MLEENEKSFTEYLDRQVLKFLDKDWTKDEWREVTNRSNALNRTDGYIDHLLNMAIIKAGWGTFTRERFARLINSYKFVS
jgi:hypothetical protein